MTGSTELSIDGMRAATLEYNLSLDGKHFGATERIIRAYLTAVTQAPVAYTSQVQLDRLAKDPGGNFVMWGEPLPYHGDIPLYASPTPPAQTDDGKDALMVQEAMWSHRLNDAVREQVQLTTEACACSAWK